MSEVFVYGSNEQGIHGAGSAKAALKHGAVRGKTRRQGHSYGISTKRTPWETLTLSAIAAHVRDFLAHADACPEDAFRVCAIGCGLAGYTPAEIAPMFRDAPSNVVLPPEFVAVLEKL